MTKLLILFISVATITTIFVIANILSKRTNEKTTILVVNILSAIFSAIYIALLFLL